MAETRINGTVERNSTKYEFYVTWEETFAVDYQTTNQSTVILRTYARKKSDYSSYTSVGTMSHTLDGTVSSSTGLTIDLQTTSSAQLIKTTSKLITHNADGSKAINIAASGQLGSHPTYGPGIGTRSSTSITLATIPRQANITDLNIDFVIGANIPINFTNPTNGYVQALTYVNNVLIKTQNLGQVTSGTLTFSAGQITDMYDEVPNALSISTNTFVRLKTYSDSGYTTQIGVNSDKACVASVDPTTNKPTFTTVSVENVDKSVAVVDKYGNTLVTSSTETLIGGSSHKNISIQYLGKLRATIAVANKMVPANSSTADKYRFTNGSLFGEQNYSAGSDVTIDINNITSGNSTVSAIDSRGLQTDVASALSVFSAWSYVDLFGMSAVRSNSVDAETTLSFFASYWKKYFSSNTTSNPGYGVLNTITMEYRYKESTKAWNTSDGTVTVTIATPGVMTKTSHGLSTGDQIFLTTTGALPTGLSASTYYYIIKIDANTFWLASSYANAIAGTKINTSGTQSGTHTMWHCGMWTTITPTLDVAGAVSFTDTIDGDLGSDGFNTEKSFNIEVRVYDKLSVEIVEVALTVGTPIAHWTSDGMSFKSMYNSSKGGSAQIKGMNLERFLTTGWVDVLDAWTYASVDGPIGVITVPDGTLYSPGMRIKLTQTTVKYFIVHAVTSTTITVYGGTDYTLANAAISDICFSTMKSPLDFPMNPNKWSEVYTDTTNRTPAASTSFAQITGAELDMPIGLWVPSVTISLRASRTSGTGVSLYLGLSDSTSSASSNGAVFFDDFNGGVGTSNIVGRFTFGVHEVASKTKYYLIHKESTTTDVTVTANNSVSTLVMRFVSAYL